jgi:chaperonin GroEL
MELKRGIDKAVQAVVEELAKLSKPIATARRSRRSARQRQRRRDDRQMIAEAMDKVGKEGVITVEENKALNTELSTVDGMQFDRGYLSPYFVTDSERMEVVLEEPYILIHEKKISSMREFMKLLEKIHSSRSRSS